jgi:hypothetical protein
VSKNTDQLSLGTVNCMAATIQNTLTRIIASPVVYARLRKEIDGSRDERGGLSYLQAIVREGIRLFPIRNVTLYTVQEDGETVGGYHIVPGITVALNDKALLHSKSIWGADADMFRPERWLEATPTAFATMHQVLIAPWGVGETATLHQKVYQTAISGIILQVRNTGHSTLPKPDANKTSSCSGISIFLLVYLEILRTCCARIFYSQIYI